MPAGSPGARPRSGGVFYGWTVVAAAGLVLFMAYGTQYAFGVFFAALMDEFGWSRASLSGVFSLYALVYSGFALVAGRLTDRWGPRTVIAIGGALLGLGLVAMSGVGALWQPYVLYGTVAALGMSTAYVPCNATVAKWFTRRRGLAVGLRQRGRQPRHVRPSAGGPLPGEPARLALGVRRLRHRDPRGPQRPRSPHATRSRGHRPRPGRRPRHSGPRSRGPSLEAPTTGRSAAPSARPPSGFSSACSPAPGLRCSSRSCTSCRWRGGSASRPCWPRRW